MDHNQAVEQMAAERYLLDELPPKAREVFEEHIFGCPECALDLRVAAAFVDEAKVQLPALRSPVAAPAWSRADKARAKRDRWLWWLRPGFVVPAFAALLLVAGYQNLITLPALRSEANQPRLLPLTPVHGATRGGAGTAISADRAHGVAFPIDLAALPGPPAYTSYAVDLFDLHGKLVWAGTVAVAPGDESSQRLLLAIPAPNLNDGGYAVAVSGVGPNGERTPIDRYVFDVHFTD
jgi:Putative zinc-finger